MKAMFIVYGAALCLLLAYTNYYGMTAGDFMASKFSPKGKQAFHHK